MKIPHIPARSLLKTIALSTALTLPQPTSAQTSTQPPPPPPPTAARPPVKVDIALPDVAEAVHRVHAQAAALGSQLEQELDFHFDGDGPLGWIRSGGRAQPLVIAPSGGDSAEIVEDLQIMTRLLQKAVQAKGTEPQPYAMGIPLFSFGGANSPQTLYIEGHGAIFVLNAPFPLKATEAVEATAKPAPAKPSAWEQTRRELYGPKQGGLRSAGAVRIWDAQEVKPQAPYDPEQVDRLRQAVLESLKHANNIRALKREDSVTVLVNGPTARKPGRNRPPQDTRDAAGSKAVEEADDTPESRRGPAVARLGFKAHKADIEAFATGSMPFEVFRSRAQVWEH